MPMIESPQLRLFLRRLALGVGLAAFFAWLALRPQAQSDDDRLVQHEFLAMGTVFDVSLYLQPEQARDDASAALRRLERVLQDYEARWRAWPDGGSAPPTLAAAITASPTPVTTPQPSAAVGDDVPLLEPEPLTGLADLNRALAAGQVVTIPDAMRALLDRATQMHSLTHGRFDVRIGALVALWGFDDEAHFRNVPPPADDIATALAALQTAPALAPGAAQYGPAPGVVLDFGAIAKGDATDLAIRQLRDSGYPDAIVNAGGNLRAAGRRGERAWRIGIRHPRPDLKHRLLATLDIAGDEAVITSGDYERYFEVDGLRYHHLLDPLSGEPARGLQSVTVVADRGATADAASTALFVAGPEHWQEQAAELALDKILVVDSDGQVWVTPRLAERLTFPDGIDYSVIGPGKSP